MSYEIFETLCRENGTTPSTVAKACGVNTATITHWKHGLYTPKEDKRRKLADYFGVSLEFLDTGVEPKAEGMTAEQIRSLYFNAHPEHRALFEIMEEIPADKLPLVVGIIKGVLGVEK